MPTAAAAGRLDGAVTANGLLVVGTPATRLAAPWRAGIRAREAGIDWFRGKGGGHYDCSGSTGHPQIVPPTAGAGRRRLRGRGGGTGRGSRGERDREDDAAPDPRGPAGAGRGQCLPRGAAGLLPGGSRARWGPP